MGVSEREISGQHKRPCLINGVLQALEFAVQLTARLAQQGVRNAMKGTLALCTWGQLDEITVAALLNFIS